MQLKWKLAAACAALVLAGGLLSACGSAGPSPAGQAGASGPAAASAPSASAAPAAAPGAALKDTEVSYGGAVFAPNSDMAAVLDTLGEPAEYSEVISCMFEGGLDKTYTYQDFTIYTYPTETQELILLIEVTSPAVQTSRGVKVGDSLDAALLVYNDEMTAETSSRYTATFGDVFFSIIGKDGVVTSITYELDKAPIA